jgi:Holliday junction resolvase RusA-like endonuclease
VTRYSTRKPDQDNLTFSFKHVVDGLKLSGVIVDDNPDAITATYLWQKAPPRQGKIKVVVEEILSEVSA